MATHYLTRTCSKIAWTIWTEVWICTRSKQPFRTTIASSNHLQTWETIKLFLVGTTVKVGWIRLNRRQWIALQTTNSTICLTRTKPQHWTSRCLKSNKSTIHKIIPCTAVACICRLFLPTPISTAKTTISNCLMRLEPKEQAARRVQSKLGITLKVWTIHYRMERTKTDTCNCNNSKTAAPGILPMWTSSNKSSSSLGPLTTCIYRI